MTIHVACWKNLELDEVFVGSYQDFKETRNYHGHEKYELLDDGFVRSKRKMAELEQKFKKKYS